jgi:hypothetical protein
VNGPEHYREAERLLAQSHVPASKRAKTGWCTADELVAAAQAHATLALVAATAQAGDLTGNMVRVVDGDGTRELWEPCAWDQAIQP